MSSQNPSLRMENPRGSNQIVKSSIVNCICPECGGALSLATKQFRCQGRCGTDWRPVWIHMQQSDCVLNDRLTGIAEMSHTNRVAITGKKPCGLLTTAQAPSELAKTSAALQRRKIPQKLVVTTDCFAGRQTPRRDVTV
jgi:hypothetical protein